MNTVFSVRLLQAVALTAGMALLLWSMGFPTFLRIAHAGPLSSVSDTITNSAPSEASDHLIAFTSPSGVAANQNIDLVFNANFDMTSILFTDVDLNASGTEATIVDGSNGAGQWGFSTSSNTISLQAPTDYTAGSSTDFIIEIGTNAWTAASGTNQIINPSSTTTSYEIDITAGPDTGQARVAIVETVLLSATVDASLTFSISGVNAGVTVNGSPTTTAGTTTPTSVPFGTLPTNGSTVLAQDLAVSTNAQNGYTVTVQQDTPFQSTLGGIIDNFIDGAYTYSPTAWVAPSNNIASSTTWGHWAITSEDGTTSRATIDEFGNNEWASASTTPTVVMGHTGPADGQTAGIGATTIGYQVGITELQEAGDDYEVTLRYIATPTF